MSLAAVRQELDRTSGAENNSDQSLGAPTIPVAVTKLADDYAYVSIPNWHARVARKDGLANELANYINTHRVSRDALAKEKHKGLIIGLASAIHSSPEAGDADRLLKIAKGAKWLHVKFRVLLSLTSLVQHRLLDLAHVRDAREILDDYENDKERPPDRYLKRRISATRRILEQFVEEQI